MNSFREKSTDIKNELVWMWIAFIGLAAWLMHSVTQLFTGNNKYGDIVFIILFAFLLAWRFLFKYEYILNGSEMIVIRSFMSFEGSISVSLDDVETFSDKYKRKFVIRQRISKFLHWYSSGDTRPTRALTFLKGKKRIVLIFKVSDIFMDKLISRMPDRFVPGA